MSVNLQTRFRGLLATLLVTLVVVSLSGCDAPSDGSEIQTLYGRTMGTSYSIKYVGSSGSTRSIQLGVDSLLADLNQTMSTYIDDSELNQFNDHFGDEWIPVSEQLFNVVSRALEISKLSNGAFDVTVGPLVDLWGFGPKNRIEQVPEQSVMDQVRQVVGYQAIELDPEQPAIRKIEPRRLDLSAIAKGYGSDLVAEYLDNQGISSYLVEIGGEMRLKGQKPDGQLWRVAIETPDTGQRQAFKIIPLTDASIATSGDYRNYFEVDGKRYSHTIDPATGYPISHTLASVSVIADNCRDADAFATAMMVMGVEKSLALAEQQQLAVFLIEKTEQGFVEHSSSKFAAYLQ